MKTPKKGEGTGPRLPTKDERRAFYGLMVFRATQAGPLAQAWPRRRGPGGTPAQLEARADWKRYARMPYDMMPQDQVGARLIAAGSAYTWRDVLSRALVGRLIDAPDLAAMGIQVLLDEISTDEGAMIFRDGHEWTALAPPTADKTLAFDIATKKPHWIDAASAGITQLTGAVLAGPGTGSQAATLSTTGISAGTYNLVSLHTDGRAYGAALVAYLTQNDTITLSGDASGSGRTSIAVTLGNSGVTPGTYNLVTVDAKGRTTAGSNAAYLTANQTITLSGDASGSGTTSIVVDIADTGVTPGTYTVASITVGADGRISAASDGTGSGGGGPSFATLSEAQRKTASVSAGGSLSITFDSALTVGNVLLFILAGYKGGIRPPAGVVQLPGGVVAYNNNFNQATASGALAPHNAPEAMGTSSYDNQSIRAFVKPVVSGDGTTWAFNIQTDRMALVALELSNAGRFVINGLQYGQPGSAALDLYSPLIAPEYPGEQAWIVHEQDGHSTHTTPTGWTEIYDAQSGASHEAVFLKRNALLDPGDLEIVKCPLTSMSATTQASVIALVRILPLVTYT